MTFAATETGLLEQARAWQRHDGNVAVQAVSEEGLARMRFVLGVDDDHSEFVRLFQNDRLLARPLHHLRGLRPLRTATVAHALLRAVAGQLITAREARQHERTVIRAATRSLGGLHAAPTAADLGRFSPAELRRLGLATRRGAALIRLCRGTDLELLKRLPTDAAA